MVDLQDAAARMYAAKKFRNASKGITAGAADFDLKEVMTFIIYIDSFFHVNKIQMLYDNFLLVHYYNV